MTDEKPAFSDRAGDKSISRRTTIKRVGVLTAATATGITTSSQLVAADNAQNGGGGGYETIGDDNIATTGAHVKASVPDGTDCEEVELTTSSALYEPATPYDKGGPVTCYWGAQAVNGGSKNHVIIKDLTVTVQVENTDTGWVFESKSTAERDAPESYGWEPSFDVGVSLFYASFSLEFSDQGDDDTTGLSGSPEAQHDFGEVVYGDDDPPENQGWLRVNLENPNSSDPSTDPKLTTTVEALAEWRGSGPGPCGTTNNGDTVALQASETYYVEIE